MVGSEDGLAGDIFKRVLLLREETDPSLVLLLLTLLHQAVMHLQLLFQPLLLLQQLLHLSSLLLLAQALLHIVITEVARHVYTQIDESSVFRIARLLDKFPAIIHKVTLSFEQKNWLRHTLYYFTSSPARAALLKYKEQLYSLW